MVEIRTKSKSLSLVLTAALLVPLALPTNSLATDGPIPQNFTWDEPGPTSPVLHPGSTIGAGMVEEPLNQIDDVIEGMVDEGVMPGAVTFVARKGHIVQHEAYGYSYQYEDDQLTETDQPIPTETDTIYDLASLSKLFTTTAAMTLYDKGYFDLDDPVAKYIPEFSVNEKDEVTIRQLMTHTSGFPAWIPLHSQGENREERMQIVYEHELTSEPGTSYTYSDLNMITLGGLIERLTGERLDEYVERAITKPLKLNDTMYNPPEHLKPRIAATEYQPLVDRGLVWGEVHDENAWGLDGVAGHAGLFSTAEDLGKFAHMFLNGGRYGGKQIVQEETVDLMLDSQIPELTDQGLGFEFERGSFMGALSDETTFGHTGFTGTSLVVNQENDTIAILLTNRVHPTRETPSTHVARRAFAQQVADAIPVSIPSGAAWFSGYGDHAEKQLTAEIDLVDHATLSFDTWHRIEEGDDLGLIEISEDGNEWTSIHEPFTGNEDWHKVEVDIPKTAQKIRFTYETDATVNGRGWYIGNPQLFSNYGDSIDLNWTSNNWIKRSY
ncbi:serine hydrolase [Alkalibacillus silvisoli]|uniref:Serine hydrolase domain-containing protein n=1 Tax=Alkalibacillus silvisoli TaxID=392823 RepID=A0ABN1A7T6_9BACI